LFDATSTFSSKELDVEVVVLEAQIPPSRRS